MAETTKSIGKVAITPKGNYGNTLSYERLDVVFWDGSAYICIKDAPPNSYPSTENSPYWMLLAKRGYTSIVPKIATLKAEMVDEHYAYVYIGSESGMTNGDWYYYDSQEAGWVSGGAYNPPFSTDTGLTEAGAAADAKVVGDKFATTMYYKGALAESQDLDVLVSNGSYYISAAVATAWHSSNGFPYTGICRIHVLGGTINTRAVQIAVSSTQMSYRIHNGTTWGSWREIGEMDTTLSIAGVAADAKATGDAVSKYFNSTSFSAQNQFAIADMPANSHTYHQAKVFSDCPAGVDADDYLCLRVWAANAYGNVRQILCYDATAKRLFSGRSVEGTVTWFEAGDAGVQTDLQINNTIDLVDTANGVSSLRNVTYNGITYTWQADGGSCTISGTATALSFNNFISAQDALPASVTPGSYLTVEASGLARNGAYLTVYLYPNTLPNRSYRIYGGRSLLYIPESCTGILIRLAVDSGDTVNTTATVKIYSGISKAVEGDNSEEAGVKMLVFGSSFSYSTLGLLPQLFSEICPNRRFVLGICYLSGATLQNHNTMWSDDTVYPVYSEYDSQYGYWTNTTSSITGKTAVMRHRWDYITLQQACRYVTGEANYTALATFADAILSYVTYPFTFLYNLVQSLNAGAIFPSSYTGTGSEKSDAMFLDVAAYAQRAMNDQYVTDVIPGGTAVQNARQTSLDQIGDAGDLAYDNNGHLQNGIATLVPAYAALFKICELSGIKPKTFGSQFNPDDTKLANVFLYTRDSHGLCEGVTAENKIIAQKCALMAVKHPYEISDMPEY